MHNESLRIVGHPVPRLDLIDKATGRAIFGVDLKVPGMLHGQVLRSRHAHARILSVDTSKAEALPGVAAVVTARDVPLARFGICIADQPILDPQKVRFYGDAVAAVAAVDADVAEEALDLIEVEYEELPAVFDAEEAMQPGAPLVHEEATKYWHIPFYEPLEGTNVAYHFKLRKGDIDQGFAEADHLFEDRFFTHMVQVASIEPHVAVANWETSSKLTVWTSTQAPFQTRFELSQSLGLPMSKIRVIVPYVGGGFGGKQGLKVEGLCALLSRKAQRPVKITLTREEEFKASSVRHPCTIYMKTGVRADGSLLAREVKLFWDTGAYCETGAHVCRYSSLAASGPYNIPHVKTDGYLVYTNNPIGASFRGFGVPQITWAHEVQMDIIAEALGIDPVEMRLMNAVEEGTESASGERLRSVGLKETIRAAADSLGWNQGRATSSLGHGVACMHKFTATPTSSSAVVKLNEDGSVAVFTSAVEIGQGAHTVLAQIAAEQLGVRLEDVSVSFPDTDATPYDLGVFSSRTTFYAGNAVKQAATSVREQLFERAAASLEANPADLVIENGKVFVRGSPSRWRSLRGLSIESLRKGGPILGNGTYTSDEHHVPLDLETGQGRPSVFWMYATHGAEVAVDVETGHVFVKRMTAAHDVGKAINPMACEQQIEGGLAMGIGCTLYEEMVLDHGNTLNPNFTDYRLPTALDIPQLISLLVEEPHEEGPFGAKGLGEPAYAPTSAAIGNAVYHAVGVRVKELPMTPEKLYWALKEQGN